MVAKELLWMASCLSGLFENQRSAVVQLDFPGLPCRACSFATYFAKATKDK